MPRPPLLVSAVVLAALLAAIPAATAPAASPEAGTVVRVELELEANHGLHAHLETSDDEMVTLELRRERRFVSYEAQGEVSEEGLKVRFGRLGLIEVTFAPTKTLSTTEPSPGCTGEPRTLQEGVFTGTIDFTGEREYVRIEGTQVEGSMSVISQWQCLDEELRPFAAASRPSAQSSRDEKGSASLHAFSRRCSCFFATGVHYGKKGGASIFYGAKTERREGMEIVSVTSVPGGTGAFVFDHAAGTATLRPPQPLSGQATFERRPGARNLWRSTIRVPLLGFGSLRIDGPGFRAALYPEYHFD